MARKYLTMREYVDLVGEDADEDALASLNAPLGMCREVFETKPSYSKVCSLQEGHRGDHDSETGAATGPSRRTTFGGRRV